MSFYVTVHSEAFLAALRRKPDVLRARLTRVVQRLSIEVQSSVKSDALSGRVLHVRTGTLRRSINRVVRETRASVTATVGTNVSYAAAHEYGFDGTVAVRGHLRRIKEAFGRSITPVEVSVAAHSRAVHLPERSFLRSTLKAFEPRIREQIKQAATEALRA